MKPEDKKQEVEINEDNEELGSWTKKMIKPENLLGPFDSTEEMLRSMLED